MENNIFKCSNKEHNESETIRYCQECNIYMCNKCEKLHSGLFQNHHLSDLNKDIKEIFTGICQIENHNSELDYFCKTHNELCCAKCIAIIKSKGNGNHRDCDVCDIEEILISKKNNLKNNIKILENLSNSFQLSIDELKKTIEIINKNKEEIKLNISNIFTKIRNALNNREDELLLEVDNYFKNMNLNEEILKDSLKLPNKIQISLEKGKLIDKENNNFKQLNSLINDCINIEKDIKDIYSINDKIKLLNSTNLGIQFYPDENNINILKNIKEFGNIIQKK